MPRAIWTGSISFGLVNIPVKLYPATVERDVRFRQFARGAAQPIRYRRVVDERPEGEPDEEAPSPVSPLGAIPTERFEPAPGELDVSPERPAAPDTGRRHEVEVPYEEVVKGYEVAPGRYVMVEAEELAALRPPRDHVIEINGFVQLAAIDPVYFDRSYYVAPQAGPANARPYALLLRAMEDHGKVGIARFVLRTKEHLAAIRPMEGVLALETMFFADEIVALADIWGLPAQAEVSARELDVAGKLIDLLATDWDPSRYADTYRQRVLELIESKRGVSREVVEEEPKERPGVPDLLAALRASVEAARAETRKDAGKEPGPRQSPRRRRTG